MIATLIAPYPLDGSETAETKQYLPSLNRLILRNNRIASKGAEYFGKALSKNNILTELDLSLNTAIGDQGCDEFIKLFASSNTSLTKLSVAGCQIGIETCKSISNSLCQWAMINERLSGADNGAIVTAYESSIQANTTEHDSNADTEERKESANKKATAGLSAKGGRIVGKKANANSKSKKVAPKSGKKENAKKDASLHALDSQHNSKEELSTAETQKDKLISEQQVRVRLEHERATIKYPCGIQELDISSNGALITDDAAKILLESIKVNRWVTALDIRGCSIGEFFTDTIAGAISSNKTK